MSLNSSGKISIGGPTVGQSINLELNRAATAPSSLGETELRTLADTPSGIISLASFYGKSSNKVWNGTMSRYSSPLGITITLTGAGTSDLTSNRSGVITYDTSTNTFTGYHSSDNSYGAITIYTSSYAFTGTSPNTLYGIYEDFDPDAGSSSYYSQGSISFDGSTFSGTIDWTRASHPATIYGSGNSLVGTGQWSGTITLS